MNAVSSMNRLTRKARRVVLAWGLVAAAGPISIAAQSGHGVPSGSLGGDPMQSNYRSDSMGPNTTGPGSIEQTQFDFLSERPSRINQQPVRRYVDPSAAAAWQSEDEGAGGIGLGARVGHNTGNTVGRDQSITNFELMPYVMAGDQMVFGSFRFFRSDTSNLGGSTGLGYRHYVEDWNKVLGISGWYDLDDHRGVAYEQGSLGFEVLGDTWDVRANWYIPFGDLTQIVSTNIVQGSQRFAANSIFFSTVTDQQTAANGVDVMFTVPVPGDWAAAHNLEASAGFYHFLDTDNDASSFSGYRLRADAGFWNDLVHMYTEVNSDPQTDVGVSFGVSLDWHGGINTVRRRGGRQKNRMGEFVRRNDHVVTIDTPLITPDVQAINPTTGAAYTVAHVDRARNEAVAFDPTSGAFPLGGFPAGGVGTFEDPFSDANGLTAGLATGSDIVFVAGGATNTFNTAATVGNNQALLGEATGVTHLISVVGLDNQIALPAPSAAALDPVPLLRPTISDVTGTAVSLGSNSRLGGFVIDGTVGGMNTLVGISAANSVAGQIRDVSIININGDGVTPGIGMQMVDTSGLFVLENFQIGQVAGGVPSNGATGTGFLVNGGTPIINTLGMAAPILPAGNLIANTSGNALEVRNMTGGNVGLANLAIFDTGGDGVLITETAGRVTLGNATLTNTTGSSVRVLDIAGAVDLLGTVTITDALDDAFVINDLDALGTVSSITGSSITINQGTTIATVPGRDHVGLQLNRIAGNVALNGSLSIDGPIDSGDEPAPFVDDDVDGSLTDGLFLNPAINFQNSTGSVLLSTVAITDRGGVGINIGDNDIAVEGTFDPTGMLSGMSPNEDASPDERNFASAAFTLAGISTINNTGGIGTGGLANGGGAIEILNDRGTFQHSGTLGINGREGMAIAVSGLAPGARASFASVTVDDSNSVSPGVAVRILNNQAPVSFSFLEIDSTANADYIVQVTGNNRANVLDPLATAGVDFGELNILNADLSDPDEVPFAIASPVGGVVPDSALVVTNNDSFELDTGVFEITNGRAITAINNLNTLDDEAAGTRFITLESITSDADATVDFTVFMDNNRGDFTVTGLNDAAGSGGTITGGVDAMHIDELDGDIDINFLQMSTQTSFGLHITNNMANDFFDPRDAGGNTILVNDTLIQDFNNIRTRVNLNTVEIEGAPAVAGFQGTNIETFTMDNSIVDVVNAEAIQLIVNELNPNDLTYLYQITNSSLENTDLLNVAGLDPIINIVAQAASDEDTSLTLLVDNNVFDDNGQITPALDVNWDGTVVASVTNNVITTGFDPGNNTNINGNFPSSIDFDVGTNGNTANILISGNTITQFSSDFGAITIETNGEGNVTIDNNIFTLDQDDGFAIELDLAGAGSDASITSNIFNMVDDGQTVVNIDTLVGPGMFEFDNNVVNFNNFFFADVETVLQFQTIGGTIDLDGANNAINGFDQNTIFFAPQGTGNFTGVVEINGTNFQ